MTTERLTDEQLAHLRAVLTSDAIRPGLAVQLEDLLDEHAALKRDLAAAAARESRLRDVGERAANAIEAVHLAAVGICDECGAELPGMPEWPEMIAAMSALRDAATDRKEG